MLYSSHRSCSFFQEWVNIRICRNDQGWHSNVLCLYLKWMTVSPNIQVVTLANVGLVGSEFLFSLLASFRNRPAAVACRLHRAVQPLLYFDTCHWPMTRQIIGSPEPCGGRGGQRRSVRSPRCKKLCIVYSPRGDCVVDRPSDCNRRLMTHEVSIPPTCGQKWALHLFLSDRDE